MRVVLAGFGLVWAVAASATPIELAHQGRILDVSGQPFEGEHDITVSLWTAQAPAGVPVWTESHVNNQVSNGYFSLRLGDTTPLGSELLTSSLFLQVQVESTVLTPREELVHVPLAAQAEEATLTHHIAVEGAADQPTCTDPGAIVYDTSISAVRVCAGGVWDPPPSGDQSVPGGLSIGTSTTCDASTDGVLRWQAPGGLEVCDGGSTRFVAAYPQPVFWQGGCSQDTVGNGSWYFFCTDETTHETAVTGGYLTVSPTADNNATSSATGRITVQVDGWYRINVRHGTSGAANAYQQIFKNGSAISYSLQNGNTGWKNQTDSKVTYMEAGDFFNVRMLSNSGINADDDGDYTLDGIDYQRRNYIRVEYLGTSW
jgi:hypothetical protein